MKPSQREYRDLSHILGEDFPEFVPKGSSVLKETFQTSAYASTKRRVVSMYGNWDEVLYTIRAKGKVIAIASGKNENSNPKGIRPGVNDGVDLRKEHTTVFCYEQEKVTVVTYCDGERMSREMRAGSTAMLDYIKHKLGKQVDLP